MENLEKVKTCTCYEIPSIREMMTTMIVNTVDAHHVSLQIQSIQMCDENMMTFVMLSNDLCSENPCDEAQSDDFEVIH